MAVWSLIKILVIFTTLVTWSRVNSQVRHLGQAIEKFDTSFAEFGVSCRYNAYKWVLKSASCDRQWLEVESSGVISKKCRLFLCSLRLWVEYKTLLFDDDDSATNVVQRQNFIATFAWICGNFRWNPREITIKPHRNGPNPPYLAVNLHPKDNFPKSQRSMQFSMYFCFFRVPLRFRVAVLLWARTRLILVLWVAQAPDRILLMRRGDPCRRARRKPLKTHQTISPSLSPSLLLLVVVVVLRSARTCFEPATLLYFNSIRPFSKKIKKYSCRKILFCF